MAYNAARAAELDRTCSICGADYRSRRHVEIHTCSPQCAGIRARGRKQTDEAIRNRLNAWFANGNRERQSQMRGPLHPQFMGRRICDGYIWVWTEEYGYIQEHRLMMQQHLSRELAPSEIVHHKNRIKTDNRIDNFEVMTRAEHIEEHRAELRA